MAEFQDLQQSLGGVRDDVGARYQDIVRLKGRIARLQRELRSHSRRGDANHVAGLEEALLAARRSVAALRADLGRARERETRLLSDFRTFSDPRQNIGQLSDRTPILLQPLRIETRFKSADQIDSDTSELWVRVYPDDISVDSFEPTLTETEAHDARTYWTEIWSAGGDDALERGAWKVFLAGQGSGRSHWITQVYAPGNAADKPAPPLDTPWVILTIATRSPLLEPELSTVRSYWANLWRAGDDLAAQTAANDALNLALGEARAQQIRDQYRPNNFATAPAADTPRDEITVIVSLLHFPTDDEAGLREAGWATTPQTTTLPDCLVLMGYNNNERVLEQLGAPIPAELAVAPDPSADEADQLQPNGADLSVSEEITWLTDFNRAVEIGMGFRVPLDAVAFRRGFDQLMVLGVQLRTDAEQGQERLQALISSHHQSKTGFSILPQGQPTNNVEDDRSGYSWQEDSDVSFDHYFGEPADDPPGWFVKSDGRWLADTLGLDPTTIAAVPHYSRTDIRDARAMNVALWPATLGYFMESMMHPIFDDRTVTRTREFFTRHVSARGTMPAIRVGKQPYGLLPASPRSRLRWLRGRGDNAPGTTAPPPRSFHARLYSLLRKVENDMTPLLEEVSYIGKPGKDPHQVLLDVVGLHGGSVEFQQRYAESFSQLYNRMALQGSGGAFIALIIALGYTASGLNLLDELGYTPDDDAQNPDILEKLFVQQPNLLKGGLVDDLPVSETDAIRAYTEADQNYIGWLIDAASTSHDTLRQQAGFTDGTPNALLYLMLRHALDLSFIETSVRLRFDAGLLSQTELSAARREPAYVQVTESSLSAPELGGGSRWQHLYLAEAAITGAPDRTIGEFIPTVLTTMTATAYLNRQLNALRRLEQQPTAALERAFAEHVDLCTYRLDAWYGGLHSLQLEQMRTSNPTDDGPRTDRGIYLGAWGWLEDVRPDFRQLEAVELDDELSEIFNEGGEPPLLRDSQNQGYIHAPSLNHAVTAAVLRNGYLSNATPDNPTSLAVNLSSERVRNALGVIEGMKAGQSLGALLGYQFERGLHDRHDVEVDEFIYDLRKEFPLAGDRLRPTRTGRTDEVGRRINIRQVEARNVIDGQALVEHLKTNPRGYPFGLTDLPGASAAQADAISAEAERLRDTADAVADVAMAESVHQVAQGNYERAGATLDTYSKGKFPATPDVVRTPRSGVTLTCRTALHLPVGLDPTDVSLISPRSRAEPALDSWLAGVLPAPGRVACVVTVADPDTGIEIAHTVTQADLGLAPSDLLYLLDTDNNGVGRALDDRVEAQVIATHTPRPHSTLAISYRDRIAALPDHVPFFELAAMVRALRRLVLRSRPIKATDMSMTEDASATTDVEVSLGSARITFNRDDLLSRRNALDAFAGALNVLLETEPLPQATLVTSIDTDLTNFVTLMRGVAPFAEANTGTASIFAERRRLFAELLAELGAMTDRWQEKLDSFDAAIDEYNTNLGGEDDDTKFRALLTAQRLIATDNSATLPPLPDTFRDTLTGVGRAAFVAQRSTLVTIGQSASTLGGLHDALIAEATSNADFHPEPLDLTSVVAGITTLSQTMAGRATSLVQSIDERLAAIQTLLDTHDASTDPLEQIESLTKAAHTLFGDDFKIIPDFALPAAQAGEWRSAWGPAATPDQALLDYQITTLERPFPVDDWFTGMARVRGKMRDLETISRLAGAFGTNEPVLSPLQFPHRAGVPWLALEFPDTLPDATPLIIDEDKLLYTGHFTVPFTETARQAGLLIDEWTEVVPSRTEDTGLAFHYDRPNSEPPQALLLALPADFTGSWQWADLVDGVRETMDLARRRAIEPDQMDTTAYARFLPAVISAVTTFPLTASLNFSFNNNLAAVLAEAQGDPNE